MSTPRERTGVKMTYQIADGTVFEFSPTPFIQCDRAIDLSGKEETGFTTTINFTGTLVAPRHLEGEGIRGEDDNADIDLNVGQQGMNVLERLRRKMEYVLSVPGGEFRIYCQCGAGDTEDCQDIVYFRLHPSFVGNLQFQNSPDNWVITIPYTFQMVTHHTDLFDSEGSPIYLESIDENWSIEQVDEKIFPTIEDTPFETATGSQILRLTHTLTATGKKVYGEQQFESPRDNKTLHEWRRDNTLANITEYDATRSPDSFSPINVSSDHIKTPYEYAKDWIETRLRRHNELITYSIASSGTSEDDARTETEGREFFFIGNDGIFNYNNDRRAFNHTRQRTGNETTGQYTVTESWFIIVGPSSGVELPAATDEYSLDYRWNKEQSIVTVSIEGTIQGYQEGDITERSTQRTKINQAEELLHNLLSSNILHDRCEYWLNTVRSAEGLLPMSLNNQPVTKTVRRQTLEGIITYSMEFNNKCPNLIEGTLSETFSTAMTYPNDVFAQVVIPGRQRGPLFFSANTQTAPKYTVNFEVVMDPLCYSGTGVTTYDRIMATIVPPRKQILQVIKVHYDYLKMIGWDILRVESDSDTWNPAEGRYSGTFTFTGGPCRAMDYLKSATQILPFTDVPNPIKIATNL